MSQSDLVQYYSLSDAAAQLDIHPFDIARYLSIQKGGMPNELRLTHQKISQIAKGMGLQNWWSEPIQLQDDNRQRLLLREMARRILEADWSTATRADNLNRGLEGDEFSFVRRVINSFIRCNLLLPKSTLTGLTIEPGPNEHWSKILQHVVDFETEHLPTEILDLIE